MSLVPTVPEYITVHLGTPDEAAQNLTLPFTEFVDRVAVIGKELGLEIHAMHEDIFDSMHKI